MCTLPNTLDIIIKTMKEKGITQKELCERLGLKQQAFTNWKNGNNTSYMKHLVQIATVLDVNLDYLLGHDDDLNSFMQRAGITPIPVEEQAMRPVIGMASAGSGVLAQEQILGWESVEREGRGKWWRDHGRKRRVLEILRIKNKVWWC